MGLGVSGFAFRISGEGVAVAGTRKVCAPIERIKVPLLKGFRVPIERVQNSPIERV